MITGGGEQPLHSMESPLMVRISFRHGIRLTACYFVAVASKLDDGHSIDAGLYIQLFAHELAVAGQGDISVHILRRW
jgi:hypothetical protein